MTSKLKHKDDKDDPEQIIQGLAAALHRHAPSSLPSSRSGSASSLPLLTGDRYQRQHQHHSIWECETTPMTTRPHFERYDDHHSPPRPMRRVRSRSLGSAVEREHRERSERGHLLLPLMDWDVYDLRSNSANCRRKSEQKWVPSTEHDGGVGGVGGGTPVVLEHQPSSLYQQSASPSVSQVSFQQTKDTELEETFSVEQGDDYDKEDSEKRDLPAWVNILYGMINATIVLPVLMSFGSIIYRDDAFAPYIPVLVKLTLVSGIVHQLCFSTFSSLPFAVGQVQDAGLIFLSSMASEMVRYCRMQGHDDETMLATVTVCLAMATACLGCGLVAIGYLNLGQYVQLLPTCVVGGYLAYIGWFCGEAGVGLMAGSSDLTFEVVTNKLVLILPGALGGLIIYLMVTRVNHVAALPLSILFELVLFYFILWATGTTVEGATQGGWIRQMDQPPPWYRTWDFLRPSIVDWSVIPNLMLTELGMLFVVALSSCLDVAAIEIELNRPLNYNHELKTVGLSNIISGVTGGYTGSYIFSQSIFSLRAGVRSRLNGYVIAICQVVVVILPLPVLSFVPNFFFGSLLSMICIDLMYEWLWDVRRKLTSVEYLVCLSTFVFIQFLSVEYGIVAGVALYVVLKKFGFDVGVAKFSTSDEAAANEMDMVGEDLLLVEEMDDNDGTKPTEQYGTML